MYIHLYYGQLLCWINIKRGRRYLFNSLKRHTLHIIGDSDAEGRRREDGDDGMRERSPLSRDNLCLRP